MSPTLSPGRFSAASKIITSLLDVYTSRHLPESAASSYEGEGVGFIASSLAMSSLTSARTALDASRPRLVP